MYGKLALCFIGLSSGGVIAAGIFAFLAIIGVFPRLIGVTHTRCHVILYETLLILGGTAGNLMDLFHLPLAGAGTAFLALWGLALGVFVPGDVPGRDLKGASSAGTASGACGGDPVSDPFHCRREIRGSHGLFFQRIWR